MFFEQTVMLIQLKENVIFYLRFIDGILLVWNAESLQRFEEFKSCMDSVSKLQEKTEKLNAQNFLKNPPKAF